MRNKTQMVQFDLEYFFDLLPDLLFIAGYDGYLKKINPAVSKTLGYSSEELLGSHIDTLVHPEDKELTARKREQLRKGETLFQFENRYLRKDGAVIWLLWTAVPVIRDQIIFAIAKDITDKKSIEQQETISTLLGKLNTEQMKRFSADLDIVQPAFVSNNSNPKWLDSTSAVSQADQLWLKRFESVVRNYAGKSEINLRILSADMAVSERQLFRQVKRIMGITPNQLVRMIRLHLAWEAIASRKYRTLSEISRIAGYHSNTYFKKLFSQVYGIEVSELL
ncbi:PAS domain S-box protein [Pedobacter chitinilyticus]|uniref:PAS domain S-box protein n=1 Tax=Pedobacter chitinilyticus TaxID=2233776 RepID=A0A451GDH9_9SPHI|nr:PAS domain S-box protein [Pedobacter chitinilyticus]RWU10932.1 PAS domain S-box protein [Pedobacter chitinilyticus]